MFTFITVSAVSSPLITALSRKECQVTFTALVSIINHWLLIKLVFNYTLFYNINITQLICHISLQQCVYFYSLFVLGKLYLQWMLHRN